MIFKAKTSLAVSAVVTALASTGCTSVDRTPIEEIMAVQTVLPVSKPGQKFEGLPSADEIAAAEAANTEISTNQEVAAGENAVSAAVTEVAQNQGPTVELASAAQAAKTDLAYAAPGQTAADAALNAQLQPAEAFDVSAPASMTVAAKPGTSREHINSLIAKYSALYGVPERLVHHVANRESTYNPKAYRRGNYGLMQIRYNTAKGLGYTGKPDGLLDAETNLKYAVKYLRNAWIVAEKDEKAADWLYRTGYYYEAKRKGLLNELR